MCNTDTGKVRCPTPACHMCFCRKVITFLDISLCSTGQNFWIPFPLAFLNTCNVKFPSAGLYCRTVITFLICLGAAQGKFLDIISFGIPEYLLCQISISCHVMQENCNFPAQFLVQDRANF